MAGKIKVKFKTAKGKIIAIALGGVIVFGTWAGIHLYNNFSKDTSRTSEPSIGDTELPSDDIIEPPTEPNFEIPTEPEVELPTEENTTDINTEDTSSSDTELPSGGETEDNTDEPIVEEEINRNMAVSLITTLNQKVQNFLNDNNSSRRPTITGIEELSMAQSEHGYTFIVKVEGFMNAVTPSYIQITANSTDEACDELYEMFTQTGDINASKLVTTLDSTIASEYTHVTSCKSLKSLTIDDQTTSIDTIFTKSNIEFVETENYKLKSFVNTTPVTADGINTYEVKINITGQLNSYFTTLTIASDKALSAQSINNYVVAILNDEEVDIHYDMQTAQIPNSNIFKIVKTLNNKLEEKELTTDSLSK